MHQLKKIGRVSIADRNGILYLVWNAGGKRFKESTGHPVNEKKIPAAVLSRVKQIDESFAAQRGRDTLAKLGVHIPEAEAEREKIFLDDAIEQTIRIAASHSDHYKDNLRAFSKYFQRFMRDRNEFTKVPTWDKITQNHVIEFILAKQSEGLSNKTIRHYVAPIITTSRVMADVHPTVYRPFVINMRKYLPLKRKEIHCLTFDQIMKLEPLCKSSNSRFSMPLLMLGALAGLNIAEIQSLQKRDWNTATGVLTIRRAKTQYRERKIPVVAYVRAWCDQAFADLTNKDSYLITTPSGNPMPENDFKNMGRAFARRVLEPAAKLHKDDTFLINPSDCRESFTNLLVAAKVGDDAQRAYTGHAPKDVHAANYADYTKPEILRDHVIKTLEKKFKALANPK